MRKTFRSHGVKEYWTSRWEDIPADNPMKNMDAYPLKYAEMMINDKRGKIIEAGCGAGRVLRYYHGQGYNILGMDFISVAIDKLKDVDSSLHVEEGDITSLKYTDQSFKYVLAFGLYHNLEIGLDKAILETYRILEKNGSVCASFRADNIQTWLTDWLADRKTMNQEGISEKKYFHKMNLTRNEYVSLFTNAGFTVNFIEPVENMPILYKFSIFRSTGHKKFDENKARSEGYRLSWVGQKIQNFLMQAFPNQFCNIYVLIAKKI